MKEFFPNRKLLVYLLLVKSEIYNVEEAWIGLAYTRLSFVRIYFTPTDLLNCVE